MEEQKELCGGAEPLPQAVMGMCLVCVRPQHPCASQAAAERCCPTAFLDAVGTNGTQIV